MVVHTNSARVQRARQLLIELYVATCPSSKRIQDLASAIRRARVPLRSRARDLHPVRSVRAHVRAADDGRGHRLRRPRRRSPRVAAVRHDQRALPPVRRLPVHLPGLRAALRRAGSRVHAVQRLPEFRPRVFPELRRRYVFPGPLPRLRAGRSLASRRKDQDPRSRDGTLRRKTMSYTRLNSSAATLTKNRTEDAVVPISGMCATCVDGCIGMCEIGKSAYRGAEMIYPQPFGIITTAGQKDYPVDLSHFTILGRCAGAWGIEPDSNRALFPNVDLEVTLGRDKGIRYKLPFTLAAMGSTNVAKNNWPGSGRRRRHHRHRHRHRRERGRHGYGIALRERQGHLQRGSGMAREVFPRLADRRLRRSVRAGQRRRHHARRAGVRHQEAGREGGRAEVGPGRQGHRRRGQDQGPRQSAGAAAARLRRAARSLEPDGDRGLQEGQLPRVRAPLARGHGEP